MFKFTRVFLLFQLLVLTVNGADQNSMADIKSNDETLQEDLIEDLGTKRGQEIKRHPNYGKCLHGFTYLPSTGSCYKVIYESLDWYWASKKCEWLHRGSHLAAITSAEENRAVKTFLATEVSRNCTYGFTYLPSTGNCYKVVYESHDWYSAGKKCQELRSGSRLIAITSAEENSALKTFLATEVSRNLGNTACILNEWTDWGNMYWTSGQQLIQGVCQSPFVWKLSIDTSLAFDYTDWNGGEPNCGNDQEFCVGIHVYSNFRWDDILCSAKTCPLCEYKP